MAQVTVKQTGANQKLKRLEQEMFEGARKTAKFLAQLGVAKAQVLVPKDSGKTAGAINAKPTIISPRKVEWQIVAPEVYDFPVVKVMQGNSAFAKEHWKKRSEERRKFMLTTRKYLNDIKSGVAKGGFRNIKIN